LLPNKNTKWPLNSRWLPKLNLYMQKFSILKFPTNMRAPKKRCEKNLHDKYRRHLEFWRIFFYLTLVFWQLKQPWNCILKYLTNSSRKIFQKNAILNMGAILNSWERIYSLKVRYIRQPIEQKKCLIKKTVCRF
jgi:hypothetical protein